MYTIDDSVVSDPLALNVDLNPVIEYIPYSHKI